jgi:EAL domain-containing protein (putative c-di-GMP-specific phosphodiesterase class I)
VFTAAEQRHVARPRLVTSVAGVRDALEHEQLLLHYLPIVDLETGLPRGAEALLRWQHPIEGVLGPDEFLSSVAQTPLMHDITGWVVRTAVQALASWPTWTVSVNVTAHDVTRPQLVEQVEDALDLAGIAPERLVLELTEQAVVENRSAARTVLGALRDRGVGLSLDDFGTGYCSLLYLRELPITELKIDRTFVSGTPASAEDTAIVSSLAALGQAIGVGVVAEGVETREQLLRARDLGCTGAQGYLWGSPAAAEDLSPALVQLAAAVALSRSTPTTKAAPRRLPRTREDLRIKQLLSDGASLHTIAAALNREGLRTPNETRWTASSVAVAIADNTRDI